jgi:Ca2+-binding RTX toxin-like protein
VPAITSFLLQYTNVNFSTLFSSTFDLVITEGAPLPRPNSFPQLTDNQVDQLQAQGRRVAGYVNVSVTDTVRSYWNNGWTTNGDDLGMLTGAAPGWLQGQPANNFGRIVKFWDPAWQQIVIDQAVNLVTRGYKAIFLDDVAQYYALGAPVSVERTRELATLMAEFVTTITNAVRQINADVTVIVNSDPYMVTNVTGDARGSAAAIAFLGAVDYHLMENQSATAIGWAETHMPGEPLLLLDTRSPPLYSNDEAWTHGVPYYTPDYNSLGTFSYRTTNAADTLYGGDGPNQINGLGGNDMICGLAGNDALDGGTGADSLYGGIGNDTIYADPSDLVLDGGAGTDTLIVSTSGSFGGALSAFEALQMSGGAAITMTGSQFASGFAETSEFRGTGIITINMDVAGNFITKLMSISGGISMLVNGTSGNDIFKLGNVASTINTGDGSNIVQGGSLVDTVTGGSGIDKIAGNGGADILTGGAGADVFKYRAVIDSGIGATADRITDFVIGSDRLNFSRMDANAGLAGDQAFNFVGTGNFGGGAGSIRYENSGANLLVKVDINGDGSTDMEIILVGRAGGILSATDFVL